MDKLTPQKEIVKTCKRMENKDEEKGHRDLNPTKSLKKKLQATEKRPITVTERGGGMKLEMNTENTDVHQAGEKARGTVCCQQRWILAFMGLWLGIMSVMLNANINVAIVCMVKTDGETDLYEGIEIDGLVLNSSDKYNISIDTTNQMLSKDVVENGMSSHHKADDSCEQTELTQTKLYSERTEFSWNKKTRSIVLSSYYYGFIVLQIPGGWLAVRFGGKRVIGTSMLLSSALTLLMPIFARTNVYLVIVARVFIGLLLATTSPSICELVGTWSLPEERSRMLGMCWFGQNLGAVLGYSTSGLLCVHGFDNGWASIFYIHGIIGFLFVVFWWFLVYSTPRNHPRISTAEKRLLLHHKDLKPQYVRKTEKIPWKALFTYVPVYVVVFTHICEGWTFYLLLTSLPMFLKEIMKFDMETNGIFSCLPYITFMIGIAVSGACADFIRSWQRFSTTSIRKTFQVTSLLGVSVFILIPGYLTCEHRYSAVACLCLCTFFESIGVTAGFFPNMVDIAPRYSSLIFGVSNTAATIPGIIAPVAVAAITQSGTSEEWRVVFFIAAGISVCAAVVYGVFANSELAPWAAEKENTIDIEVELTSNPEQNNDKLLEA